MLRGLTLSQKGLIIISLPLICEMLMLLLMMSFAGQVDREVEKEAQSKTVISDAASLSVLVDDIVTPLRRYSFNRADIPRARLSHMRAELSSRFDSLARLCTDAVHNNDILALRQQITSVVGTLDETIKYLDQSDAGPLELQREKIFADLRYWSKRIQFHCTSIMQTEKRLLARQEEDSRQHRKNFVSTVTAFVFLNFVLTIALGMFVIQKITRRLSGIAENAMLLASGKALKATVSGSDEIADVDRVMHGASEALSAMSRREGAIIENAADLICSIDGRGTFTRVNPASTSIIGRVPGELLGLRVSEVVHCDDLAIINEVFDAAPAAHNNSKFDLRMIHKGGFIVETLWSMHWSQDEQAFFCVIHDVTDRKRAEKLKSEVMNMVSHDLRSPLTTVMHFHEMLEKGSAGQLTESGRRMLQASVGSVRRMKALVDDLLFLEHADSGTLVVNAKQINLQTVIDESLQSTMGMAAEHGVELRSDVGGLSVYADQHRLAQVITNLITNAIKFSPAQGVVQIQAQEEDDFVLVRVSDKGRGIPASMREAIFEPFAQATAADANIGGTGLGLTICKSLVELHGGRIWVDSEEGGGSTFSFTIPRESSGT